MEDVTNRHDHEAEVDATALRELNPNAVTSGSDPSQSKDQNLETKITDATIVDANGGAMYDDLDNAAQDEDDPEQPVLTAGQVPKKKKKKRKPKSQRGLVLLKIPGISALKLMVYTAGSTNWVREVLRRYASHPSGIRRGEGYLP